MLNWGIQKLQLWSVTGSDRGCYDDDFTSTSFHSWEVLNGSFETTDKYKSRLCAILLTSRLKSSSENVLESFTERLEIQLQSKPNAALFCGPFLSSARIFFIHLVRAAKATSCVRARHISKYMLISNKHSGKSLFSTSCKIHKLVTLSWFLSNASIFQYFNRQKRLWLKIDSRNSERLALLTESRQFQRLRWIRYVVTIEGPNHTPLTNMLNYIYLLR